MRGMLLKIWYENRFETLLFGFALMAVNALLTFVLPEIQKGLGSILEQLPFVRSIVTALLGTELGAEINARTMQAFLWVHPVVLALIWAHEITLCTRFPAGEIDRGTIDVLLGLPISRRKIYICEAIWWLSSGVLVLTMGFIGHRCSAPLMPPEMRPELKNALFVMANLYGVYVAVGGIAFLVASFSDHRGRAMAVVFAVVVASFLLNFVAQFWSPAKQVALLSVMEYYQPAAILQSGSFPTQHVAILLIVGGLAWAAGGEIVARRSLCTV